IAPLMETIARAIHAAHQHGIVHRDLKPGNVMLTEEGAPKVADFGLAKQLDAKTVKTQSGDLLGTPSYMAPEQAAAKVSAIGPATDVYALGAILYELLVGRAPFDAASLSETLEKVASEEPVPPRKLQRNVPIDLQTICLKCLEKKPARRYASALELAEDLSHYQNGEPIKARPVGVWGRFAKWVERRPERAV